MNTEAQGKTAASGDGSGDGTLPPVRHSQRGGRGRVSRGRHAGGHLSQAVTAQGAEGGAAEQIVAGAGGAREARPAGGGGERRSAGRPGEAGGARDAARHHAGRDGRWGGLLCRRVLQGEVPQDSCRVQSLQGREGEDQRRGRKAAGARRGRRQACPGMAAGWSASPYAHLRDARVAWHRQKCQRKEDSEGSDSGHVGWCVRMGAGRSSIWRFAKEGGWLDKKAAAALNGGLQDCSFRTGSCHAGSVR